MKRGQIAIGLALVMLAFNVRAQNTGSTAPGSGTGNQHQHRTPDQIAAHLMKKFDANKDGVLDLNELTQAIEARQEHHQQAKAGGGGQGGSAGNHQGHPSPEKIAAHMMEKFSSDKNGLTESELAQAIAAHQAKHQQQGGGHPGGAGSSTGGKSSGAAPGNGVNS